MVSGVLVASFTETTSALVLVPVSKVKDTSRWQTARQQAGRPQNQDSIFESC